jgi:predicted secreted protein
MMGPALLSGLLLAGCAAETTKSEVVVSACDTSARVPEDGTLVVRLESQFTTGYLWSLSTEKAPTVVEAVGDPTTEPDNKDRDGGSQWQVFRFKAVAAGSETLTFHKKRSWEKGKPPLSTCTIKVEVAE